MPTQTELPPDRPAQEEMVRLHARVTELETHVAGLLAQRAEACTQLWATVAQSTEGDDQILVGRVREALTVLGESEERFMITVGELYEAVETDYAMNRRRRIRNIQNEWRNHLQAVFGSLPAHGVSADHISAYIVARQKEGAANATINREMSLLKRVFKLAIRTSKLTRAPWIPHLRENNVRRGFVTNAQYAPLARATAAIGPWMRALFEIGFVYGWRKSELLGLKVRQVDLLARTLVLDPGTTKNDESCEVRLTDEVVDLLTECIAGLTTSPYRRQHGCSRVYCPFPPCSTPRT